MYILSCLLYDVIGGANCRGDSNAGHGRGLFPFTPMIMALYYVRIILQKPTYYILNHYQIKPIGREME